MLLLCYCLVGCLLNIFNGSLATLTIRILLALFPSSSNPLDFLLRPHQSSFRSKSKSYPQLAIFSEIRYSALPSCPSMVLSYLILSYLILSYLILSYLILSYLIYLCSLADRWGTTVILQPGSPHSSRLSAFRSSIFHSRPVHYLMLSSHRFLCLPLRLPS